MLFFCKFKNMSNNNEIPTTENIGVGTDSQNQVFKVVKVLVFSSDCADPYYNNDKTIICRILSEQDIKVIPSILGMVAGHLTKDDISEIMARFSHKIRQPYDNGERRYSIVDGYIIGSRLFLEVGTEKQFSRKKGYRLK